MVTLTGATVFAWLESLGWRTAYWQVILALRLQKPFISLNKNLP